MNCETYETLRIDAAEAPGMAEHLTSCSPCQSFNQAASWMDRELPGLDAPELPVNFAATVAARARAERVLSPWYRRLTQDAASAAEATWRALAVGGLVGCLAGTLGLGAAAVQYGEVGRWGYPPSEWAWTVHAWNLQPHFLADSGLLLVLIATVLALALRPWLGVRRVLPMAAALIALTVLLAALQTVGLWPVDTSYDGLEVVGGTELLVVGVGVVLLSARPLLRTASSTMGQAAVFYGTLGALFGILQLQQHWAAWIPAFREIARTATIVVDPHLVLGGVALLGGVMAGALAALLTMLREPQARGRGMVLLVLAATLLAATGAVLPLAQPPRLALSAGAAHTWTFVAPGADGTLFHDRLTVHDWNSARNEATLQRMAAGNPLDRYYATELRLCQERLLWDRQALERDVPQASQEAAGLANLPDEPNPWWELLPAGDWWSSSDHRLHTSVNQLSAVIHQNGRPVSGARLFLVMDEPGRRSASLSDLMMSTLQRNVQSMEWALAGRYPRPGYLCWDGYVAWGVSDVEGRVEIPVQDHTGQLRPMLLLPGDAPVRAVEGLPLDVTVPHSISLGTITVRR
ncbi:MAG TPA: hypothetical protein VGO93_17310 [Candidatus Xenobia bacterium]